MTPASGSTHAAPRSERRKTPITPKNGRYPVLLLAGGPADRARELRDAFALRRGALVKYHWDYEKQWQRPVPADVDLVVLLKTMAGHSKEGCLLRAAAVAGVPVVKTSHKWTVLAMALHVRFGWGQTAPLPLAMRSTAYLREVEDEAPQDEVTEAVPLSAPDPVPLPAPAPPVPAPPVPSPTEHERDELRELRREHAKKDSMLLVAELQQRLALLGASAILISPAEVVWSAAR